MMIANGLPCIRLDSFLENPTDDLSEKYITEKIA